MSEPSAPVYLDHAATSWPKHESVLQAMDHYHRDCGAAAGRGGYRAAQEATKIVDRTRVKLARLVGAGSASDISFHANGTAALNAAIHGYLRPGDHVVTSAPDHNSVLRPLHHLSLARGIEVSTVPCNASGVVSLDDVRSAVRPETRLVAITHASNVTGAIQPIHEIGSLLKSHPAKFLCDAAQTVGYCPIDVDEMNIDLLASPGHKGAMGPLGTGFLYAAPDCQPELLPTMHGGTGSISEQLEMPSDYPSKLEPGNLNVAAIAGWSAGLDELLSGGPLSSKGLDFSTRLHDELGLVPGIRLIGRPGPLGVVSLTMDSLPVGDLATILDVEFNIAVRSGLHCAAQVHDCIGTSPQGTVRISTGHTTTHEEISHACDALSAIAAEM